MFSFIFVSALVSHVPMLFTKSAHVGEVGLFDISTINHEEGTSSGSGKGSNEMSSSVSHEISTSISQW